MIIYNNIEKPPLCTNQRLPYQRLPKDINLLLFLNTNLSLFMVKNLYIVIIALIIFCHYPILKLDNNE